MCIIQISVPILYAKHWLICEKWMKLNIREANLFSQLFSQHHRKWRPNSCLVCTMSSRLTSDYFCLSLLLFLFLQFWKKKNDELTVAVHYYASYTNCMVLFCFQILFTIIIIAALNIKSILFSSLLVILCCF